MNGRRPSFAALPGVGIVAGLVPAMVMVGVGALLDANPSGAIVGAVAGAVAATTIRRGGPTNGPVEPLHRESTSWGVITWSRPSGRCRAEGNDTQSRQER